MSAKICPMCQINLAMDLKQQKLTFGRHWVDDNGDPLCDECIQEKESEDAELEYD